MKKFPKSADSFPARLRYALFSRGVKQGELAAVIGKTRQAVGYYADGTSSPDWMTLRRIAEYLNVSTDWLLGLSACENRDADLQAVCEYLGVTESCVRSLVALKQHLDGTLAGGLRDNDATVLLLLSRVLTSLCD